MAHCLHGTLSSSHIRSFRMSSRLTGRAISRRRRGRKLHLGAISRAADRAKRRRSGEATRGRLYCVDRWSAFCAIPETQSLHAPIGWSAEGGPSYQCNRRKTFHHIRPYRWNNFPHIVILNGKIWKNGRIAFRLLQFTSPNYTYCDIKGKPWKMIS